VTGRLSRRQLLAGAGVASAAAVAVGSGVAGADDSPPSPTASTVPFAGAHQAGIVTPEQDSLVFAVFDVTGGDRASVAELLASWTQAARRMCSGQLLTGPDSPEDPPPDTGEALGLSPSRLTVTVGFGPTLFDDRFGLAAKRPAALVDLPAFAGDALDPILTGGDLCIQACADNAQVAFHAVHELTRLALGSATVRYIQTGFARSAAAGGTSAPRNLLGFHDGTSNLDTSDADAMNRFVWVDDPDPGWMTGGSYLVARRIRIFLEAWDRSTLRQQEATIGRTKVSGAPLGATRASDPADLGAIGDYGQSVIPQSAHIRVAAPASNEGQAILRRGYSFMDGVDPVTGELDAGLFFLCFQKDPRNQYVPIQSRLALNDALASYLLHTGSGVFACPPGPRPGGSWGDGLL
jgi:deferrochelatase/peroxidase EfeB